MKVTAKLNNVKHSPNKMRVIADQVRDLPVAEAISHLDLSQKKAARYLKKVLVSAVANAENNFDLVPEQLSIDQLQVGEGMRVRKPKYRARGRLDIAKRRYSNVHVVLRSEDEEKEEQE